MSAFPIIGSADLGTMLAWTLVSFLWQATLLGALAWCTLALCGRLRPRSRYAVSLALFASLVALPIALLVQLQGGARDRRPVVTDESLTTSRTPIGPAASVFPATLAATGHTEVAAAPTTPEIVGQLFARIAARWSALQEPLLAGTAPFSAVILVGWLLGVVLLGARLLLDLMIIRALRRSAASPLPPGLAVRADALRRRAGIGASVRIAMSARVGVPLVLGALRPVVLLPSRLVATMPEEDVELLIAHEIAHIERLDYAVNLVQCVVECVLFFHPLTWWLSNTVRTEREHCCDERALQLTASEGSLPRVRYIRALLAAEETRSAPAPRLAPSSSRRALVRRAAEVLERKDHERAGARVYATISGFALTLIALIALPQPSLAALHARLAPASAPAASPTASLIDEESAGDDNRIVWRGTVPPGAWLRIRNLIGDVRVERTAGTEVEVRAIGQRQTSVVSFRTTREADGVTVCAIRPGVDCDENGNVLTIGASELLGDSVTLLVRLPDGLRLLAASSDGALHIAGRPLAVQAQTGKGEITVRGARGPVEAATGGGAVRVEDVAGGLVVRSGGGAVTLVSLSGDAQVRASSGDIDASVVSSPGKHSWSFQTSSGSIRLRGAPLGDAHIEADAPNGEIKSEFAYQVGSKSSHTRAAESPSRQSFLFASTSAGNVTISGGR